jgi:flagellar hook-associated protein 1 FlgK
MALLQQTEANDLEDRRDLLLDSLATLIGAVPRRELDGSVTVSVAGSDIVRGDAALPLSLDVTGGVLRVLDNLGTPLDPPGGEMAGLTDLHNLRLPAHLSTLDGFARQLADALNAVHRSGYGLDGSTGLDLYRYDPAAPARTLTLAPEVAASPLARAASAGGQAGDGEGALALARVMTDPIFGGQGAAEFWASTLGTLGLEVESVTREVDNTRILARQADNRRAEVMGVNLDEETAHLIRCQHAYAAAARLITTADEMLETLINRTGRVGR